MSTRRRGRISPRRCLCKSDQGGALMTGLSPARRFRACLGTTPFFFFVLQTGESSHQIWRLVEDSKPGGCALGSPYVRCQIEAFVGPAGHAFSSPIPPRYREFDRLAWDSDSTPVSDGARTGPGRIAGAEVLCARRKTESPRCPPRCQAGTSERSRGMRAESRFAGRSILDSGKGIQVLTRNLSVIKHRVTNAPRLWSCQGKFRSRWTPKWT